MQDSACQDVSMALHTFTTPHGTKIRTATKHRYVVVYDNPDRPNVAKGVEYRTDDPFRAKAFVRKHGGAGTYRFVVDTITGVLV